MNAQPEPQALAEEVLWSGHPSYWNWWLELSVCALLVLLALALSWISLTRFSPIPLACAAFLYAAVSVKRLGKRYRISNQRVVVEQGYLSKRVAEVEVGDIRSINLVQSFLQRLTRTGDIEISSAANDGVDVHFAGVLHPESVKERIRQARHGAPRGNAHARPE